ncbi:MAG TPA: ABC transporter permease [Ktedonobacteraceae bacterium]|nr:ABC transporter permease [Ktedonobacteraceae bacterium]
MNTLSLTLHDSATMLRRDIRHSLRRFSITLSGIFVPVIMMLLFVYFFGGAIGGGIGSYIDYVTPGIIIMTVGSGCATTALNLCMDVSEGIITRFRTMAISRSSVLVGQVIGSLIRTMISIVLITLIALLIGFRPTGGPLAWLAAPGLIVLLILGVTWMGVAFGLVGKTPAGANSLALIFQLLAFTSSAFVRPDSMPAGIRWFSEYQPFSPVIDTVRGLLLGTPIDGSRVILALVWCIALILVGYFWARAVYNRGSLK